MKNIDDRSLFSLWFLTMRSIFSSTQVFQFVISRAFSYLFYPDVFLTQIMILLEMEIEERVNIMFSSSHEWNNLLKATQNSVIYFVLHQRLQKIPVFGWRYWYSSVEVNLSACTARSLSSGKLKKTFKKKKLA